jgi:hypothetical protein
MDMGKDSALYNLIGFDSSLNMDLSVTSLVLVIVAKKHERRERIIAVIRIYILDSANA